MKLDAIDLKLLALVQNDAELQVAELGARVGLSATPCWRRLQKLKASGVITRRVAVLDPVKVNLPVLVFVAVRARAHTSEWFTRFKATVQAMPEVMEAHRMSGDIDYLLRIAVADIASYDRVYQRLIAETEPLDVSASFAMEALKATTALPLPYTA